MTYCCHGVSTDSSSVGITYEVVAVDRHTPFWLCVANEPVEDSLGLYQEATTTPDAQLTLPVIISS